MTGLGSKRIEDFSQESEEKVFTILDNLAMGVSLISPKMEIIWHNKVFRDWFPEVDVKKRPLCYQALYSPPREKVCDYCPAVKTFKDGKKHTSESGVCADGNIYLVTSAPLKNEKGEITYVIKTVQNIAELKRREEALNYERKKLINILDSMEDGVYIVNQQHDIEYVNPALKKEFGPFEGRKCYAYFHDRKEVCPWCKNKEVFAGKTVRWEWDSFKNQKTYDLIDTPLKNPDGSISKLEIFRDITDRKRMEEELRKSNRLKDLFIDIVDHDLINKVSVIGGVTEIMNYEELPVETRTELGLIKDTARKLEEMIRRATSLSKLEAVAELTTGKRDLVPMIERVIEELEHKAKKKDIEMQFDVMSSVVAPVNSLMEEVFLNLISNAIKYSPKGSKVIVDLSDQDNLFRFTVADNGEGVPDEYKEGIFLRFHRAHKRGIVGSGLGLAIVKRVVELHRGKVWVEDNPEGGSIFYVTLPKG